MNRFTDHIHTAAHEHGLTDAEKLRMRSTLHAYMALKPRRAVPVAAAHIATPFSWVFAHRVLAFAAVLAILGSSAGVSYAAESALPGDPLYAIKTNVNEPLRGVLATTPQAKAEWAIQVAGERAKEAATLAAEKRLDATTQAQLETSLVAHAQIATAALDAQATSSPATSAEVATRFEARLSEYERVIAAIGTDDGDAAPALAVALRTEREHVAVVRAKAEDADTATDTEALHSAASGRLAVADKLAKLNASAFSSSTANDIAASLDTASSALARVRAENADDATRTRGELRRTIETSEKLATFVETSAAIHDRTGITIGSHTSAQSRTTRPAAVMATFSAPASFATDTAATTTATSSVDSESQGDESSKKGSDSHDNSDSNEHVLELSVPGF